MILRLILIIFFFSPFTSAQNQISIDYLNNALKQNYLFVERSLNKSALNIEESSGKIFFNKSQLVVEILSPYKERYLINKTSIEIHDLDLDQKRIIDLNELKNLNLQDIKEKITAFADKKTLIKFGISFGSIVVFLIIYYSILNPIVNAKKAKLNDMNNKIE